LPQVLVQVGKERLTTTKVALRAGVSVGTLYQYFPNKSALLKAALKRHMDEVTEALELVCHQQKGHSLEQMATALMTTFLEAKPCGGPDSYFMHDLCSVYLTTDPQLVASMLRRVMGGSRRLLESTAPEKQFDAVQQRLRSD